MASLEVFGFLVVNVRQGRHLEHLAIIFVVYLLLKDSFRH